MYNWIVAKTNSNTRHCYHCVCSQYIVYRSFSSHYSTLNCDKEFITNFGLLLFRGLLQVLLHCLLWSSSSALKCFPDEEDKQNLVFFTGSIIVVVFWLRMFCRVIENCLWGAATAAAAAAVGDVKICILEDWLGWPDTGTNVMQFGFKEIPRKLSNDLELFSPLHST